MEESSRVVIEVNELQGDGSFLRSGNNSECYGTIMKPLVIYRNTIDCFTAAWVYKLAMPDAEFIVPPLPDDIQIGDRKVYVVDITPMEGVEKSAGRMAWEQCWTESLLPKAYTDRRSHYRLDYPPLIVTYIEDALFGRFNGSSSREINAALASYEFNFATWDNLAWMVENRNQPLIGDGIAIMRHMATMQKRAEAQAKAMASVQHFFPRAKLIQNGLKELGIGDAMRTGGYDDEDETA